MESSLYDNECVLPDEDLTTFENRLQGFDARYLRVHDQLQLLIATDKLNHWNQQYHDGKLQLCELIADQYPLAIFHGDVGTGKTATAECVANRLIRESGTEDSMLFTIGNRIRGKGLVGEMGTNLTSAFNQVIASIGKQRRAVLIIDEADSLGTARTEGNSHHEDKVAVNTLIQCIDGLRKFNGRILVILCTNRLSILDPALRRRAAITERFDRPNDSERSALFKSDLEGLAYTDAELVDLVKSTGPSSDIPGYTFSDVRTRLYPTAISGAFPDQQLRMEHLIDAAKRLQPSPALED